MAKKSFKEQNPALQFITAAQVDMERLEVDAEPAADVQAPAKSPAKSPAEDAPVISIAEAPTPTPARTSLADARKSKRLNLLLPPALFHEVTKLARMKQTSVNALICTLLAAECEREEAEIARFDQVFGTLEL